MRKSGVPPRKAQKRVSSTRSGSAYTLQRGTGRLGPKEQMKPAERSWQGVTSIKCGGERADTNRGRRPRPGGGAPPSSVWPEECEAW